MCIDFPAATVSDGVWGQIAPNGTVCDLHSGNANAYGSPAYRFDTTAAPTIAESAIAIDNPA